MKFKQGSILLVLLILLPAIGGCQNSSVDEVQLDNRPESYDIGHDEGFQEGREECESEYLIPLKARPMDEWSASDFGAAGMDNSEKSLKPWFDASLAAIKIEEQMITEQGFGVTFFSPEGQAYADKLNETIQGISDQNPGWFNYYLYAKSPGWMALRAGGYLLKDPETGALWSQTYTILADMTNKMAATDSATEQERYFQEARQQIEGLKRRNKKFSEQIDELKGEPFKQPTASQLRVFHSDNTYAGPIFPVSTN